MNKLTLLALIIAVAGMPEAEAGDSKITKRELTLEMVSVGVAAGGLMVMDGLDQQSKASIAAHKEEMRKVVPESVARRIEIRKLEQERAEHIDRLTKNNPKIIELEKQIRRQEQDLLINKNGEAELRTAHLRVKEARDAFRLRHGVSRDFAPLELVNTDKELYSAEENLRRIYSIVENDTSYLESKLRILRGARQHSIEAIENEWVADNSMKYARLMTLKNEQNAYRSALAKEGVGAIKKEKIFNRVTKGVAGVALLAPAGVALWANTNENPAVVNSKSFEPKRAPAFIGGREEKAELIAPAE